MKLCIHILLSLLCLTNISLAQTCELPVISSIHSHAVDGFTIDWLDFNSNPDYWEIEFGIKGFQRSFEADITDIDQLSYTFTSLSSGTSYEVYIRSVCTSSEISSWNGPYFINTAVDNFGECNLDFELGDNDCPTGRNFFINIELGQDDSLGINLILDRIELIIDHPWPPDLEIKLYNPRGESMLVSSFNGNGTDDYGSSDNPFCEEKVIFSDNACQFINQAIPPFIGEYKPETSFTNLFDSGSPNGLWILNICDRASGDIGKLNHVQLSFSEEACVVPQSFQIVDVESDNILVRWDELENCGDLQISYKEVGAPISELTSDFIECDSSEFRINDLIPETDYELFIVSICDEESNSPQSCLYYFTTRCQNAVAQSHFDESQTCITRCDAPCDIDSIWKNESSNESNWLVNNNSTPTDLTGPNGDINGSGNYIYIENQKNNCSGNIFSTLISSCLTATVLNGCSFSFYYNMYGEDVGQLLVQYSTDSINWETVWVENGNQGEDWQFASIDLETTFNAGLIRFVAQSSENALRGDIALDNIKLIGVNPIEYPRFYIDQDGDGFGNPAVSLLKCASIPPPGYVSNDLDCDDNNADIHPNAFEISCNMVDENCNGMDDDVSPVDIDFTIVQLLDESCKGEGDGLVGLTITQGLPPFQFEWSNGSNSPINQNLTNGVYFCTISDAAGCATVTDPIIIGFTNILLYTVTNITFPACRGLATGSISIEVDGGVPPYDISWNNGMKGNTINGLIDGTYTALITDSNGCSLDIDPIIIQGEAVVTSGVAIKSDVECFSGNSGFIQLGISGGQAPYDINWSNGDTNSLITQLSSGSYSVTIQDNNGCEDIISDIVINEPEDLKIEINNIESINCFGRKEGQIDIQVSGGQEPYSYFWSSGQFTQDLFNIPAGNYNVTVTDFKACRKSLNGIIVTQNPNMSIQLDSINAVNCSGSSDGYISVDVTGGAAPYSYNWSTEDGAGSNKNYIENLLPGKYFLTVVDNLACKSSAASFEIINQQIPIPVMVTITDSLACYTSKDARLIAQGFGGTKPYDFNWSNGRNIISQNNRDTLNNIGVGSYNVTVTDQEGCLGISDSIMVESPDEITYVVDQIDNNDCWYGQEGLISLDINGGVPAYTTMWEGGQTGHEIDQLSTGVYQATITDQNNCEIVTAEIMVGSPPPITIDAIINNPTANNTGSIEVVPSGGTPPYSYSWEDPLNFILDSIANNLIEGQYTITVTDQEGCEIEESFALMTVSTNDLVTPLIEIYPNPADQYINIKFEAIRLKQVQIVDISGKEIINVPIQKHQEELIISVDQLSSGIYFIRLSEASKDYLYKFVVIH